MPAYVRTIQEVFGRDRVCLIADSDFAHMGINTIIVAASPSKQEWAEVRSSSAGYCFVLGPTELNQKMGPRLNVVLTDDYAPVDNLTAPMFEERFGRKRKS